MPDHLHMLIGLGAETELSKLLRDFNRITARTAGIKWQRNFFDHRLRHDESLSQKYDYIVANPVRGGLISDGESWPFLLSHVDFPVYPRAGD
ncbi:MAG: IS200/IS605 family transposase [Chthoniobacterales bacterium]